MAKDIHKMLGEEKSWEASSQSFCLLLLGCLSGYIPSLTQSLLEGVGSGIADISDLSLCLFKYSLWHSLKCSGIGGASRDIESLGERDHKRQRHEPPGT